eukprot:TRINITY_DN1839_c0_g1_i2.p1 TRINITY_DN1839_c0_g1~~TRINITY_DN1839_c0_g1_i2.p1  ORF type:complete len:490 (-),score=127.40 TRINITY_DN1839_c0_g1_i2:79-1548(-)
MPPEFDYGNQHQRVCNTCYKTLQRQERPQEELQLNFQFFLRDLPMFSYTKDLPNIGNRSTHEKGYCLVHEDGKTPFIISLIKIKSSLVPLYNSPSKLKLARDVLNGLEHPNICPIRLFKLGGSGGSDENHLAFVIKPLSQLGSLRDYICKAKYDDEYGSKYSVHNSKGGLKIEEIKEIGYQILSSTFYLYSTGLPYHHLHTANILVKSTNPMQIWLSDIENSFTGLIPLYHSHFVNINPTAINSTNFCAEVICFGNILFEMTFGVPKSSNTNNNKFEDSYKSLKDTCPSPQIFQILTKIFSSSPPTLLQLLQDDFFSSQKKSSSTTTDPYAILNSQSNKTKIFLKQLRDDARKRSFNSNETVASPRGVRKSTSTNQSPSNSNPSSTTTSPVPSPPVSPPVSPRSSSPETKKKKTKSSKSGTTSPKRMKSKPSLPSIPATPSNNGSSAPPPPPPPPPQAMKDLPPPQERRNALLSAIRNPNNLKKLKPSK